MVNPSTSRTTTPLTPGPPAPSSPAPRTCPTFYRALLGGGLLGPAQLREMKETVAEDPTDPNTTFRYGFGPQRVNDSCGANWGHGGTIFGYQSLAYWNERSGRTVVIASTMYPAPAPAAAEAPLATATSLALRAKAKAP